MMQNIRQNEIIVESYGYKKGYLICKYIQTCSQNLKKI